MIMYKQHTPRRYFDFLTFTRAYMLNKKGVTPLTPLTPKLTLSGVSWFDFEQNNAYDTVKSDCKSGI